MHVIVKENNECAQGNKCSIDNIVYQANIYGQENNNNDKAFLGMTSINYKFRYYNHQQSFCLLSRMSANGSGHWSSIPGRVIPKTQKCYFMLPYLTPSIIRKESKVK